MIDLDKYEALRKRKREAEQEKAKAEGRLEQLMERLQTEFGCKTVKQAKAMLASLESEEAKLEAEFNEALAEFEKEFGDGNV